MSKKSKVTLKYILAGSHGRMGIEIQKLAAAAGLELVGEVNALSDWKKAGGQRTDVVIDFSSPTGLVAAAEWCVKNSKPLVSGSTGLSAKEWKSVQSAAAKIPLLYSANMSLGVAVAVAMVESFKAIADWDFQIEEAHHSQKKDKPSGTAILLQSKLESVVGRKLPEPLSLRGGSIPGVHSVMAMGPDESLTLQHTAFNRAVFARGALRAARWLFDKKQPGLYDLTDLYKA